jgi:hypothetical protein
VFLLFLLLAVQVVFSLYARSAVTAAAFDGARLVAGGEGGVDEAAAEDHVRQLLGRYGRDRVAVRFTPDPDDVVLTVVANNPSFLPAALRRPFGFDRIERTVRVRIERERSAG